jgi:hypothetical protein
MTETYSFSEWLKRQRKQLRLIQRELAMAEYCPIAMIKKCEADRLLSLPTSFIGHAAP